MFLVLPIHVEAVAWVVGRAELLASLAYCAALLALLEHRRSGSVLAVACAALLVALGTFAKESAATLLAAPLLATVVLGGSARERRHDLVALGALTAALGLYGVVRLAAGGPPTVSAAGDLLDNPLAAMPFATRLAGAVHNFHARYSR